MKKKLILFCTIFPYGHNQQISDTKENWQLRVETGLEVLCESRDLVSVRSLITSQPKEVRKNMKNIYYVYLHLCTIEWIIHIHTLLPSFKFKNYLAF